MGNSHDSSQIGENMLQAYPEVIRSDSSAIVVFKGPPNTKLVWALTGVGTLTQADEKSDIRGVGKAVFTPGAADQKATIQVTYSV